MRLETPKCPFHIIHNHSFIRVLNLVSHWNKKGLQIWLHSKRPQSSRLALDFFHFLLRLLLARLQMLVKKKPYEKPFFTNETLKRPNAVVRAVVRDQAVSSFTDLAAELARK